MIDDAALEAELLRLTAERGPDRSICPSDVVRAMTPEWQPLLGRVRRIAVRLAEAGRIDILRKGKPVTGEAVRGVIRLRVRPEPTP